MCEDCLSEYFALYCVGSAIMCEDTAIQNTLHCIVYLPVLFTETYNCILQILLLFLHHPEVLGNFQSQNQFEKQLEQKASTSASEIEISGH
jgi:hypothetical protein